MPSLKVGHLDLGYDVSAEQMQRIAQRNGAPEHAVNGGLQDVTGWTIVLSDLRPAAASNTRGTLDWLPQMEKLAAAVGAVIQHPNGSPSSGSYFVYPSIQPHKGGRRVKKSTDVTPEVNEMLAVLSEHGISLGDIVDEAARAKFAALSSSQAVR